MMDPHQAQLAARLRDAGLKITAPRLAILAALESDRRHPTAEMVHESLRGSHPSLSLSTVYTTLDTFLDKGLIRRVASTEQLRVDGTTQDHDHAVCRKCGEVFDIDSQLMPRPKRLAALPHGLEITNIFVEYEVLCAGCAPGLTPSPVN